MKIVAVACFFVAVFAQGDKNTKYICTNGDEIELSNTCDGIANCDDGSDETKGICYRRICPPNTFRCHYGACIGENLKCDGTKQCADGSDENNCGKVSGSCELAEFKCASGECIPNGKLCDQQNDCRDGSDEIQEVCMDVSCPENAFHCRFGGCINLNQRCNGQKDCVDGSDESELLCKSLNCGDDCDHVQESIACPAINSTRITAHCEVRSGKKKGIVPCNQPLPVGTVAHYKCRPYYIPATPQHANNRKMVCQEDGTWNRGILKCTPECGKAPAVVPLIVNGWLVQHGKFPWHATLYLLEGGQWTFACGGSLISERVVLTAAHCTWELEESSIKVALGKFHSDFGKTQDETQIKDVERIIRQPLYQDLIGNFGSDIALLVLKDNVEFSDVVGPICIDWTMTDISDHLISDNLGMILGMGITENDVFSDSLKATYLPIVSDEKCIEKQSRDFKKYVTFTSFCAGWANGTGVCNGDSGGGLVFPKQDNPDQYVLQGIVSVSPRRPGTSFCDPNFYTVFTKVGIYVEWIHKVLLQVHSDILHDPFIQNNIIL